MHAKPVKGWGVLGWTLDLGDIFNLPLVDLRVQLQDAQDAANRALAAGLSQENADALLQAELDRIAAETQNILAQADNILADTKSEEESPNKKIFIIGGIALTLLAGFLLYRKFAKWAIINP